MPTKEIIEVPIEKLAQDPAIQVRVAGLSSEHIAALEESLDALPPIKAIRRGKELIRVDGNHTLAAHQNAGRTSVKVQVVPAPEDGDLYAAAFESNASHGKALTLKDRQAFCAHLLRTSPETSNMKVAARAGLSPGTVQRIREDLEHAQEIEPTDRAVTRGESSYYYPAQRKPGELPVEGIGESLAQVGSRVFSGKDRANQRKVASFLRRVVLAMEDGADLLEDHETSAEAAVLVLGEDEADALGERLLEAADPIHEVALLLYKEKG